MSTALQNAVEHEQIPQSNTIQDGVKPTHALEPISHFTDLAEYSDPDIEYEEEEEDFTDDDQTLYIPDVDQRNINLPMYAPLLAEKIIKNSQIHEKKLCLSTEAFKNIQTNLTDQQHELALIWIFRAFSLFNLKEDESLYKAIYMLNQVLCRTDVHFNKLQLMSVVCIWISCKVEENIHIPLSSLCMICSNQITEQEIKEAEPVVVTTLGCDLNPETPLFYIQRFLNAIDADENISNIAYFFMDIGLVYHEFLDFSPTVIAVTAVCAAKLCLNEFCPICRLLGYSHLSDSTEIRKCGVCIFHRAQVLITQPKSTITSRFKGDFESLEQIILDTSLFYNL